MNLATIDHLLTTTRNVRKRLDFTRPVAPEVVERCIEIATQAPTGSNLQGWSFVVVDEAQKRQQVAEVYRKAFSEYRQMIHTGTPGAESDNAPVGLLVQTSLKSPQVAYVAHVLADLTDQMSQHRPI